jgi:hypothetical protein
VQTILEANGVVEEAGNYLKLLILFTTGISSRIVNGADKFNNGFIPRVQDDLDSVRNDIGSLVVVQKLFFFMD